MHNNKINITDKKLSVFLPKNLLSDIEEIPYNYQENVNYIFNIFYIYYRISEKYARMQRKLQVQITFFLKKIVILSIELTLVFLFQIKKKNKI